MSIAYLPLESGRQLRNVRGIIFTFAIPLMILLIFGSAYGSGGAIDKVTGLPWVVVTTVQMAGYGSMMAALGQAFTIVTERSLGWNRQLRITPLTGTGYLLSKVVAALAVAAACIVALIVVAVLVLGAKLSFGGWVLAALGVWTGVIPFALMAVLIGQYAKPQFAQPLFMVVFFVPATCGARWRLGHPASSSRTPRRVSWLMRCAASPPDFGWWTRCSRPSRWHPVGRR